VVSLDRGRIADQTEFAPFATLTRSAQFWYAHGKLRMLVSGRPRVAIQQIATCRRKTDTRGS